ncbi:MAG: tetratricopeptide repeat protein [Bacteroidota bacterium]
MRILFTAVFSALSLMAFSQNTKTNSTKPAPAQPPAEQKANQAPSSAAILTQHFLKKYATAARWNDFDVAKDALYDLIMENPTNDSLIFTLAYYYYENQKAASALLVSQDLLARNPKNLTYLELAAVSAESLGVYDKSLQYFESLYLLSNNINTLYKVAFLQYDLKKIPECQANTDILLSNKEADAIKVVFNDAENNPKEYPMKAAVLNLKGLLAMEGGDKVAAKKAYEEALALAPDFIPAKQNLNKLK